MSARPASLAVYRGAMAAASLVAPAVLWARARRGKEDRGRMGERLGRASAPRPDGEVVWMHAVSVGESQSLLPLIGWFSHERPDLTMVVTTGTVTAAELLSRRLPPGVIHQFAPIDTPGAVARFLDHWRPAVGLFVESELWPNLILAARARGVRLALLSARISARTASGWSRWPSAARTLLQAFDLVLPQDAASAGRLEALGAVVGESFNLKLLSQTLPFDAAELAVLRERIGPRRVVLGASTHASEEALIAAALPHAPSTLLILAPRHPDRAEAIARTLEAAGHRVARRSAGDPIAPETDVYLADTLGEMGLFFRLADVAVMGGSFAAGVGGHNPLEPARLGVPVISGPDVVNFADVYADLRAAGAALEAGAAGDLAGLIAGLHADQARRARMGEAGLAHAQAQAASLGHGLQRLAALLPAAGA